MSQLQLKFVDIQNQRWAYKDYGWSELADWLPENPKDFEVLLYLGIGQADVDEAARFTMVILSRLHFDLLAPARKRDLRGRWKFFVVEEYNWGAILREIQSRIVSCNRGNWDESFEALRKVFSWDYEDYNMPSPYDKN